MHSSTQVWHELDFWRKILAHTFAACNPLFVAGVILLCNNSSTHDSLDM